METSAKTQNVKCKLGILSRPHGSSLLTQGETTVIVGVYGPTDIKQQKMLINKAYIETYFRPKSGFPGIADKLNESIIQNVYNVALARLLYPRSSIVIIIQEMQNCGGIVACAINATCLALLNSGIEMKFLVAGINCAIDDKGVLHLNPDKIILNDAKAEFLFVFDSTTRNVITSHTSGSFTLDQYQQAVELSRNASEKIFNFYKTVMMQELNNLM